MDGTSARTIRDWVESVRKFSWRPVDEPFHAAYREWAAANEGMPKLITELIRDLGHRHAGARQSPSERLVCVAAEWVNLAARAGQQAQQQAMRLLVALVRSEARPRHLRKLGLESVRFVLHWAWQQRKWRVVDRLIKVWGSGVKFRSLLLRTASEQQTLQLALPPVAQKASPLLPDTLTQALRTKNVVALVRIHVRCGLFAKPLPSRHLLALHTLSWQMPQLFRICGRTLPLSVDSFDRDLALHVNQDNATAFVSLWNCSAPEVQRARAIEFGTLLRKHAPAWEAPDQDSFFSALWPELFY